MCPGDPSSYCEHNGFYEMLPPGTHNIFVYINQNLTDAAIGRALCSVQKQKLLLFPIFYLEAAILRKSLPAQAQTEL